MGRWLNALPNFIPLLAIQGMCNTGASLMEPGLKASSKLWIERKIPQYRFEASSIIRKAVERLNGLKFKKSESNKLWVDY